jgi:hypothetical protein
MSNLNFLTNGLTICDARGINQLPPGGALGTTTQHDAVISAAILKVQPSALPTDASSPIDDAEEG